MPRIRAKGTKRCNRNIDMVDARIRVLVCTLLFFSFICCAQAAKFKGTLGSFCPGHPDLDATFQKNAPKYVLPTGHILVHAMLSQAMPGDHPNLDNLMKQGKSFDGGHDSINRYMTVNADCTCAVVGETHPDIDVLMATHELLPSGHPLVHISFGDYVRNHPNIDNLLRDQVPLPANHPTIEDKYICRRSNWTPAAILGAVAVGVFGLAAMLRWGYKCTKVGKNHKMKELNKQFALEHGRESAAHADIIHHTNDTGIQMDPLDPSPPLPLRPHDQDSKGKSLVQPSNKALPARLEARDMYLHTTMGLHKQHRDAEVMDSIPARTTIISSETELPPPGVTLAGSSMAKKITCCKRISAVCWGYRIPHTEWTSGNALTVLIYLLLNIGVLYVAKLQGTPVERGWGSLATINAMFVVIPATRNSVLTWVLGLPFDHVILYHRVIGRMAVLCVFMHGGYYFMRLTKQPMQFTYLTGWLAALCAVIIFLSSLDIIRRRFFQIFFWSHYFFLGFYVLAYLHVPNTRLYLLLGMALYGFDRFLRICWMLWPRKMTVFRNKGDQLAQVRFKKNPLTAFLGMHKTGQYYFVNFPALSLHEWHPFSVSSGPREETVELHIRALGDHTRKIVALAIERSASNHPGTWIRIDGPYGRHDFNYRRYPVLLLVGGGVGVTPVMGMMKDIYNVGELSSAEQGNLRYHCNKVVYCMWVMPVARDYAAFAEDLSLCAQKAKQPGYPKLELLVYVTRQKEAEGKGGEDPPLVAPCQAGRPSFPILFEEINRLYPKQASLVFACGPSAIVHQLWDLSTRRNTKTGALMHFHHETFEF